MDEIAIKAEVLNLVRKQNGRKKKPTVASEFQIQSGQSRADLAILDKTHLIGIEIKSEKDSLKRIRKQANDYRASFDRTILVLDGSHLVEYINFDFDFCDVWTFDHDGQLRMYHEGSHFPLEDHIFHQMLTQREREFAFRDPKLAAMSKRDIFAHFFKQRYQASSTSFWEQVRGRKIRSEDIAILSRYRGIRERFEHVENQRSREINDWLEAQGIQV